MDSSNRFFRVVTPEELLGPLSDAERKCAPAELYVAGPMKIPLPRPRVAIVGSRRASQKGVEAAAEIASIIVEAEGLSGSRHVGWETLRLGRPLFISKSVVSNESMTWPSEMIRQGAHRLDDPEKVVELLRSEK